MNVANKGKTYRRGESKGFILFSVYWQRERVFLTMSYFSKAKYFLCAIIVVCLATGVKSKPVLSKPALYVTISTTTVTTVSMQ